MPSETAKLHDASTQLGICRFGTLEYSLTSFENNSLTHVIYWVRDDCRLEVGEEIQPHPTLHPCHPPRPLVWRSFAYLISDPQRRETLLLTVVSVTFKIHLTCQFQTQLPVSIVHTSSLLSSDFLTIRTLRICLPKQQRMLSIYTS